MKQLLLVAMLAFGASLYQPANAQVSINVNIGARPQYYEPTGYYAPVRYYSPRTVVVHRPAYTASRYYYTSKNSNRHYYKNYNKQGKGHYKGRGRGKH